MISNSSDQGINLKEATTKHIGVVVNWREVTEETLLEAILTVVEDPSYQAAVDSLQNLVMDQPMHPRDAAVWWLEYLLRYSWEFGG